MTIDPRAIRLETSGDRGRYVYAFEDGSEAELLFFERTPGPITINHTETPVAHRGQGVAAVLLARAIDDFRAAGRKVVPACPYAHRKFKEHPEWADVLHRK